VEKNMPDLDFKKCKNGVELHNTTTRNAFWKARMEPGVGTSWLVILAWGKLGTKGQDRTKTFGSEWGAATFIEKKVDEKIAKGYYVAGGGVDVGSAEKVAVEIEKAVSPIPTEMYAIWKEKSKWKVRLPHGIETTDRKWKAKEIRDNWEKANGDAQKEAAAMEEYMAQGPMKGVDDILGTKPEPEPEPEVQDTSLDFLDSLIL